MKVCLLELRNVLCIITALKSNVLNNSYNLMHPKKMLICQLFFIYLFTLYEFSYVDFRKIENK